MTFSPDWLAPTATVIEAGHRDDGISLAARAAALVPALAGHSLAVGPGSARAMAVAFLAAAEAGVPLSLVRAGQPLEATASLVLDPDLTLRPGQPIDAVGGFQLLLRTSGTTGEPKIVRRAASDLFGRVVSGSATRWLLTYEPTSFAGLQVLFTALGTPGSVLVAAPGAPIGALADLARAESVEAISGTPTFWRALLVALGNRDLPLRLVTLGGETAEQPVLDRLAQRFPGARLRHIYASTEAGAVFAVQDGRAGFPAAWLDAEQAELRITDGVLQVRRARAWIDTGDLVERSDDRVYFAGRRDAMIKIAGTQVVPEEVERYLLAEPGVADVAVRARPNPITGALLEAEIVPDGTVAPDLLLARLRERVLQLPPTSRPRRMAIATSVASAAGKKARGLVG
jgi:acyl-CoA synthetase (AMP-forming)/AMP-acid ligase II